MLEDALKASDDYRLDKSIRDKLVNDILNILREHDVPIQNAVIRNGPLLSFLDNITFDIRSRILYIILSERNKERKLAKEQLSKRLDQK